MRNRNPWREVKCHTWRDKQPGRTSHIFLDSDRNGLHSPIFSKPPQETVASPIQRILVGSSGALKARPERLYSYSYQCQKMSRSHERFGRPDVIIQQLGQEPESTLWWRFRSIDGVFHIGEKPRPHYTAYELHGAYAQSPAEAGTSWKVTCNTPPSLGGDHQ